MKNPIAACEQEPQEAKNGIPLNIAVNVVLNRAALRLLANGTSALILYRFTGKLVPILSFWIAASLVTILIEICLWAFSKPEVKHRMVENGIKGTARRLLVSLPVFLAVHSLILFIY